MSKDKDWDELMSSYEESEKTVEKYRNQMKDLEKNTDKNNRK